jgi:hypothetical protein
MLEIKESALRNCCANDYVHSRKSFIHYLRIRLDRRNIPRVAVK